MPTKKRRLIVTLPPELDRVLAAMAAAGGGSQSAVMVEVAMAALPTLERMAAAFLRIREAGASERARMLQVMDAAHDVIEPLVDQAVAGFGDFMRTVDQVGTPESAPQARAPGARPGRSEGGSPPVTNRGGRLPRKTRPESPKKRAVA